MKSQKKPEKRRDERKEGNFQAQFFIDVDIFDAHSMDFSSTGVRLKLHQPVKIMMRMNVNGQEEEKFADLVWAKRHEDGTMEYGLEYTKGPNGKIKD